MKTAIGLFDDAQEAMRAAASLTEHGYDDDEITFLQGGETSTAEKIMAQAQIPDQDVRFYTEGLRNGGTLVLVRTDDSRVGAAVDLLSQFNLVDVDTRVADYQKAGKADMALTQLDQEGMAITQRDPETTAVSDVGENASVIPIIEEQIQVGKRQVQRGGVRIHTTLTERPVEEQVTLRDETIHVERRPVDRPVTDADAIAFTERSFELTETDEEAVVAKQARVVEEVVVGKEATEHTETIRDSVRRTDVDVEQIETGTRTTGTADFASYDSDFRSYYDTNFASSGATYEQYTPAFRYGYGLAGDERYRNKQWNAIEATARSDWEATNKGSWEQFKDSVRYAWQRATGAR